MKLHPLSVPYRAVSTGSSVGVSLFFLGVWLSDTDAVAVPFGRPAFAALALAGVAAVAAWQVAYYRRFEYELTDDGLEIASGVLSRRHREIPLGRIQNVDISRNAVQRALGIAVVGLETAGGGQTEASLRFVAYEEAKRLQREIQRRKRGRGEDEGEPTEETDREQLLFELSWAELALLSVFSFDFRLLSLVGVVPAAAVPFLPEAEELTVASATFWLALAVLFLWAAGAVVTVARYYDFRLTRVGDELRYERGLVQRYDGSIPLDKVQALAVRENAPMRRFGYATLSVETAGYGPGQSPSGGSEAAIPLAARERAMDLARDIEPFDPPEFTRPPKRARRRYAVRYLLALTAISALLAGIWLVVGGSASWYFPLAPFAFAPFAPVAAHLKWVNRGYDAGERYVVTRNGFWNRTTKAVPYYRVQTVIQTRTVFQRRWELASVLVDTASSASGDGRDARAVDIDEDDAAQLRKWVGEKLQESLRERRRRGDG